MLSQEVLKQITADAQILIEKEMSIVRNLGNLLESFNNAIANLSEKVAIIEKQIATKKELREWTVDTSKDSEE